MTDNISGLSNLPINADFGDWPSPFDQYGVQYAWDSVSLGLLKTCPRKYQLTIVLNWQPKTRSHHLDFGIYYHSAIETYLKHKAEVRLEAKNIGRSLSEGDEEILHMNAVRKAVAYAMTASKNYLPGMKKGVVDTAKTRSNLIRALVWYFEHYKKDNCKTVILNNGKPAVELSFRFSIGGDLMLAGHLDHLVEFGDTGTYVQDHKTTSSTITGASARYYFQQFNPDNQMTLYTTAAQVAFQTPVKGVMIDAAQLAVSFATFARDFTHRSKSQLEEFIETVHMYHRTAEIYNRAGFWPMNESACGNYGGCAFREICSRAPQVRERFLKTDFTQDKPWNPLEPR